MIILTRGALALLIFAAGPAMAGARAPDRGSVQPDSYFTDRNTLEVYDSTAAYNFRANLVFPGWTSPSVPRSAGAARARDVPVTATLPGNAQGTWLNYGIEMLGTEFVTRLEYRLEIDGEPALSTVRTGDLYSGVYQTLNAGPVTVRGGRHTLTLTANPDRAIRESAWWDNVWTGQFVWSPLPVSPGIPLLRAAPPPPGSFAEPNCDGFEVTFPWAAAWVVAEAPLRSLDDYDLYLYDDYSGALQGFGNRRAVSFSSGNGTDFVVGHRGDFPVTVYPGVVRYRAETSEPFRIDASSSLGRTGTDPENRWENVTLPGARLADVYEAYFIEGTHYELHLIRNSGEADLSFNVYPADEGGIYGRNDQAAVASGDATGDVLPFDPPMTGWYPIVVYRVVGSGADKPAIYTFYWTSGVTGVPDAIAPPPPSLNVGPNPMIGRALIRFTLASAGAVHLDVWDVLGRRVRTIVDGAELEAGHHVIPWDGRQEAGSEAPAGVYWIRLDAAGSQAVRRIVRSR